jgi:1-acyl-sn-glycerol-3-phosphate acyltransferase
MGAFVFNDFFNKIIINKPAALKTKGPLLFACNHPNSFLDALIYFLNDPFGHWPEVMFLKTVLQ